jgi:hypothetical protein
MFSKCSESGSNSVSITCIINTLRVMANSFARDGIPSHLETPAWIPFKTETAAFLRLDADSDSGIALAKGADSIAKLVADLNDDPALDKSKRCFIVAEMGKWYFAADILQNVQLATDCK